MLDFIVYILYVTPRANEEIRKRMGYSSPEQPARIAVSFLLSFAGAFVLIWLSLNIKQLKSFLDRDVDYLLTYLAISFVLFFMLIYFLSSSHYTNEKIRTIYSKYQDTLTVNQATYAQIALWTIWGVLIFSMIYQIITRYA